MQNNNTTVKKIFHKPEQSKKYVFLAKRSENVVLREKILLTNSGKMSQRN